MSSTEKLKTEPYILKYGNFWMRETVGQRKYNAGDTVNLTELQAKVYKDKIDWSLTKAKASVSETKSEPEAESEPEKSKDDSKKKPKKDKK